MLALADWAMLLDTTAWGAQKSRTFVTQDTLQLTSKLGVLNVPFWAVSIACIKISVSIQLLRLQQSRPWKIFLYVFMGIVAVTSLAYLIFIVLQCIPLAAAWDMTGRFPNAKCVDHRIFSRVSNANSYGCAAMDLILSLFPITFLRKLRRPRTEKVLIGFLMAVGLAASGASLEKAAVVRQWAHETKDPMKVGFEISTWTCIEMFIGITAACLPCMKGTFQRLLTAIGVNFAPKLANSFLRSFSTFTKKDLHMEPVTGSSTQYTDRFDSLRSVDIVDAKNSASADTGKSGVKVEEVVEDWKANTHPV